MPSILEEQSKKIKAAEEELERFLEFVEHLERSNRGQSSPKTRKVGKRAAETDGIQVQSVETKATTLLGQTFILAIDGQPASTRGYQFPTAYSHFLLQPE